MEQMAICGDCQYTNVHVGLQAQIILLSISSLLILSPTVNFSSSLMNFHPLHSDFL